MAWKDGFVIEYADRAWQVNCFKCVYCSADSASCIKTGAELHEVGKYEWRTCRFFELSERYDTESMRMKAAHGSSLGKGKKSKKKKKKGKQTSTPKNAKYQPIANPKTGKSPRKLDGVSEIVGIGTKVTSPQYGKGKVVGAEGEWVTVAFAKNSKRIRFDIVKALTSGKLVV